MRDATQLELMASTVCSVLLDNLNHVMHPALTTLTSVNTFDSSKETVRVRACVVLGVIFCLFAMPQTPAGRIVHMSLSPPRPGPYSYREERRDCGGIVPSEGSSIWLSLPQAISSPPLWVCLYGPRTMGFLVLF